jgi:hypothetical protein
MCSPAVAMRLSGHHIGLLKEYMHDLVEQARQESAAQNSFGFKSTPYGADDALGDLLAILDDRIESEGLQVGLPQAFLHEMWGLCNEARGEIRAKVWMETAAGMPDPSKARIRELTYRALIDFIEENSCST